MFSVSALLGPRWVEFILFCFLWLIDSSNHSSASLASEQGELVHAEVARVAHPLLVVFVKLVELYAQSG